MKSYIFPITFIILLSFTIFIVLQSKPNWITPIRNAFKTKTKLKPEYIHIPQVVANFSAGNNHYCRAGFVLACSELKSRYALKKQYEPLMRDSILSLLSAQNFNSLLSLEGKLRLKKQIKEALNRSMPKNLVQEVYFSEIILG